MTFQRITDITKFPADLRGCVVAIGNFDGVHRGHQAVLGDAIALAKKASLPAVVLTFEPHPRTYFKPDAPVFRLTGAATKAELLCDLGFDAVVEHAFDASFSSTPAAGFVENTLMKKLGVSHVVTGYDFHFGKGREGSPDYLVQSGAKNGFGVTIVNLFGDESGDAVSSSRVREYLGKGDVSAANGLLGYVFRVSGEVIKGRQLGRELGYPTANLSLPAETGLAHGIYAVKVRLEDGSIHDGVASYGRRPTFDNGEALLETFIFGFSGDLYGQQMTVFLHGWIRGEEKFDSADALVAQMDRDSGEAKAILSSFDGTTGLRPVLNV